MLEDQAAEVVQQSRYLGTAINNKVCFELQVDAVCIKAHKHFYWYDNYVHPPSQKPLPRPRRNALTADH